MKKILFLLLSLLFIFACENSQSGGINPSDKIEEFTVNFSVDGKMGGTILAKIKGDKSINSGAKVAKDREVVFTAIPSDDTYSIASWTLDGDFVNGTQAEYPLKITKDVNIVVKFKKVESPFLTFKSITINATKYTNVSDIQDKTITFEPTDINPITLSGEMVEDGVTVSFEKLKMDGEYEKIVGESISVAQGETLSVRMSAKKDGYKITHIPFKLKRNKGKDKIIVNKIEVDGKEVEKGGNIEIKKAKASVMLEITLVQRYEGISFEINDLSIVPEFDTTGIIATFNDFAITKDGELQVKIKASAQPTYVDCEEIITITHKSPEPSDAYIKAVAVTPWDSDDGGHLYPEKLKKEGDNWAGSISDGGPHRFTIEVDTKEKDITDITKFKLYMKDASSDKVYFDKITGSKKGEKLIVFERYRDTMGREIHLLEGTNTLDVKLYYEDEELEACQFIVKR